MTPADPHARTVAFYNERDPYAAQWLRNLIDAGHIAPGVVDERDIRDIQPFELVRFTQCHFFAGIGIWSLALRQAGWSDDRPIWTGSCPCQPFSAAGKRGGVDDERHLWPHWHWLINQCRPPIVLGEQVASKDGLGWVDLVSDDMEGEGYAFRAVDICAAGIGVEWQDSQPGQWLQRAVRHCRDTVVGRALRDFADWAGAGNIGDGGRHIRQRLYFVGVADSDGRDASAEWQQRSGEHRQQPQDGGIGHRMADVVPAGRTERRPVAGNGPLAGCGTAGELGDGDDTGSQGLGGMLERADQCLAGEAGLVGGLQHTDSARRDEGRIATPSARHRRPAITASGHDRPHAPDLGWSAADWLFCRDGKWRAVEPGTQPLAHAVAGRVGKLRAYGNALDAQTATAFVTAVMETLTLARQTGE